MKYCTQGEQICRLEVRLDLVVGLINQCLAAAYMMALMAARNSAVAARERGASRFPHSNRRNLDFVIREAAILTQSTVTRYQGSVAPGFPPRSVLRNLRHWL